MKKILPYLMLLMLVAAPTHAATTYRYSDSVTTVRGDAVGGANVTVYLAGTTTKATLYLYSSSALTTKGNPTYTDGYGRFSFYLLPGTYDITISGTNVTTYTIEDVRIAAETWSEYVDGSGILQLAPTAEPDSVDQIGQFWFDEADSTLKFNDGARWTYLTDHVFNVLDFGAVPNDTIDDTAGIQEAIDGADAAGGGTVLFPPGTFMVDAEVSLVCGSNMTLDMSAMPTIQAITNSASSYKILKINQQSNVTVIGGNFVGERDTHGGAAISQGHCIMVEGSDNVRLVGVNASDAMGDNLYLGVAATTIPATNVLVSGCYFDNAYRNNCSVVDAIGVEFIGCVFSAATGATPQGGLDIEPNAGRTVSGVSVTSCRFVDNAGSGLQIIGTKAAAVLHDISVSGCTFTGNGSASASHGAIKVATADAATISSNTIEDSDGNGIYIEDMSASSVYGNTIKSVQLNGIYIDGGVDCSFYGNVIRQCSVETDDTSDGIYVRDSEDVTFTGNHVAVGPSGNNQRYGFFADATATNDRINLFGNNFSGVTSGTLHAGQANSSVFLSGAGTPEAAVRAQVGSMYLRTDGAHGSTAYIKESGTGNTGWSPLFASKIAGATADDSTPSVIGATYLTIAANTAPTEITQLDGGVAGQRVTIIATSATNPSTITDGGNFLLSANWTPGIDDTITLFTVNGGASAVWREVCRSDN